MCILHLTHSYQSISLDRYVSIDKARFAELVPLILVNVKGFLTISSSRYNQLVSCTETVCFLNNKVGKGYLLATGTTSITSDVASASPT